MSAGPKLLALVVAGLLYLALSPLPVAQAQAPGDLDKKTFLPFLGSEKPTCPPTGTPYGLIPVLPPPTDRPAERHADLNLSLRGYQAVSAPLGLVDYGGPTDPDAPQLRAIFADHRIPAFSSAHQVFDWDWTCSADGCRGIAIASPTVTLLGMATLFGEPVFMPGRYAQIYGDGSLALVLYAEERRITLKYTREDNVKNGYTVHLENVCVDPGLLALYRSANAAGRGSLPGLRASQPMGTATDGDVRIAVRDTGSFLDPRSRKDWWQR